MVKTIIVSNENNVVSFDKRSIDSVYNDAKVATLHSSCERIPELGEKVTVWEIQNFSIFGYFSFTTLYAFTEDAARSFLYDELINNHAKRRGNSYSGENIANQIAMGFDKETIFKHNTIEKCIDDLFAH